MSSFIGHEVRDYDNKAGDRRIKDYAYALGHTAQDICATVKIISSGFDLAYDEARKSLNSCMLFTNDCP